MWGYGTGSRRQTSGIVSWPLCCTIAMASVNVGGLEVVVAAAAVAVLTVVVVVVVRASTSIGRRCRGIVAGSEAVVFDQ